MKRHVILGTAGLIAVLWGGAAGAATFTFAYSSGGTVASGKLTTSDSLDALGGYDISSISGSVNGDVISGLTQNPLQPFPALSADGIFVYDNVLYPTSDPLVDNAGILFTTPTLEYELYSNGPSDYVLTNTGDIPDQDGVLTISSAIPEPTTWALLVAGVLALGLALRGRRQTLNLA